MIDSVTSTLPAANVNPNQSGARKVLCHTPFGDVMVDEMSTPDLAGAFGTKSASMVTAPTIPASVAPVTTPASARAFTTLDTPSGTIQPDPHSIPTPQSVFGNDVWVKQPEGEAPNGARWAYNPIYFATKETAQKIAAMVGGTVVEQKALADGPMHQLVPNQMIELPNGARVNAGLIADFYNHGYPQYYVEMLIKAEIQGASS